MTTFGPILRPLSGGPLNAYGQAPQSSLGISAWAGQKGLKRASGAGPKLAPILGPRGSRRGPRMAPFWPSFLCVQPDSLKRPSRGGPSARGPNRGPRALLGPRPWEAPGRAQMRFIGDLGLRIGPK